MHCRLMTKPYSASLPYLSVNTDSILHPRPHHLIPQYAVHSARFTIMYRPSLRSFRILLLAATQPRIKWSPDSCDLSRSCRRSRRLLSSLTTQKTSQPFGPFLPNNFWRGPDPLIRDWCVPLSALKRVRRDGGPHPPSLPRDTDGLARLAEATARLLGENRQPNNAPPGRCVSTPGRRRPGSFSWRRASSVISVLPHYEALTFISCISCFRLSQISYRG